MTRAYIITNPMIAANKSTEVTLSKFLRVIHSCFDHLIVIGGNLSVESDLQDVELVSFRIQRGKNKINRTLDILNVQFRMCFAIRERIKKNEQVFFWIGDKMIFPFLAAKRRKAEINYFIMGNTAKEGKVSLFTRISSKLIRYMAEHADYICMESKSVRYEWPGLTLKKERIIHLYTDNIEMNPLEDRDRVMGMVCRLTAGKHVKECIEAMAEVHATYPEWSLEIIGSGKQQTECEQLIDDMNVKEYVKLFGWIKHDNISEKTKKWKYFLFPTDTEGMPNGLLEMMGHGIPVLATPVGGIRDIVRNGVNGYLLEDNTKETIVNTIMRVIMMSETEYRKNAEEAYKTIVSEYSLESAIHNARNTLRIERHKR